MTTEKETNLKRQECFSLHFIDRSFYPLVLTALLIEHELTFSLEESEVPNIPSLPCREASSDRDSRRSGVHPPPRYDYLRRYQMLWGSPQPVDPSYWLYCDPYDRRPGSIHKSQRTSPTQHLPVPLQSEGEETNLDLQVPMVSSSSPDEAVTPSLPSLPDDYKKYQEPMERVANYLQVH